MGPSTRAGSRPGAPPAASPPEVSRRAGFDRLPERRERDDLVPGVVQRRPNELRHARIEHDLAAAAVSDMEDPRDQEAGAGDERPARFHGEPLRSPIGRDGVEQRRQLPRESRRIRRALAERQDRESATDIERVEPRAGAAEQREQRQPAPNRVAPGVDRPQLRADVQVDARRRKAIRSLDDLDSCRQLIGGHAELRARRPDGEPPERLGCDLRVQPEQDVERSSPGCPECPRPARAGCARSGRARRPRRATRSRSSAAGGHRSRRADGGAQVRVGLADALERDPVVAEPGAPRDGPLAAATRRSRRSRARRSARRSRRRRWP